MIDFRRRQNSQRWHWSADCSNYPKETDVIKSHDAPGYGVLCEECEKKEPLKKKEEIQSA
jgi:ssDNA-binding Zn-finger/Zn-ribbon topoisomerase 1